MARDLVTPHYFHAMGIRLLRGRELANVAAQQAPPVVINETLARRFWPREDPIDRRIRPGGPDSKSPWHTIVGIVGDVRHMGLDTEPEPEMYRSYHQAPWVWNVVVRTEEDPMTLAAAVRDARKRIWRDATQAIG